MGPGAQAGPHQLPGCVQIRAGTMEHHRYIGEGAVDACRVVQTEDVVCHGEFSRQTLDLDRIAPGEDRLETLLDGKASDCLANKPVRAVEEEACWHVVA